jgi:DNA topoisomerase I
MSVAQKLYEAGLITYMRTDSVTISLDFCQAAWEWLMSNDPDNVPGKVTTQRNSKDAQEAHEAVRPTDITKASSELKQQLLEDEFALYVMIWMRSLAKPTVGNRVPMQTCSNSEDHDRHPIWRNQVAS